MKDYYGMLKRLMLLFAFAAIANIAFAQQVEITGQVTDAEDGTPIPGVNISVKGTTTGTITDFDGKYKISARSEDFLLFSYIGYDTQEIAVGNNTNISIQLNPGVGLEEVIVIGYGTVKKDDATGAVIAISSKDFNPGVLVSPQDLLVGKAAGVVITSQGGAPGSGSTIRIRGGSSLNASNDPLIIIDGVPIDNNGVSGSANGLSVVNPNDIETFTILKDASATAIYGSRASNGVIIITTKRAKAGAAMKISYNGNVSVANAVNYIDVYSGDEMRKVAYDNRDIYDATTFDKLGTESTDWQKEIFRTAISQDHNVSLSGSYKILPYRVSVGYTDQNGIMENTDMQRFTGSINLNPSFLNNTLKVNLNAKGMNINNNFGDAGALGSAINMDPTQPVRDGNELSDGYYQWTNYGSNLGTPNPVEQLMAADNKSVVNRFIGNLEINYEIPFVEGLKANLNVATDYTKSEGYNNRPTTSPSVLIAPLGWGKLSDYDGINKNNLIDFYLNYEKGFGGIHNINVTGGYSWQHFEREGSSYTRAVEDETHPYQMSDSSAFITENYLVSFFGRANYTLMDKYLLTATVRYDGSSRFAEDNRWGLFPSAALAWKIKEESFLKDVKVLSDLKLRLGWGVTGQQDIGNDYPAQARYVLASEGSYYPIGGEFLPTLRPDAYDPDIKWEETTTMNIALDFGFMEGRITGSIDFYKRVTDDLLNEVTIPSGSNFSNVMLTNVGSLENKGVELSLNLMAISKEDMSLNIGFNFTYNKNEITKLLITDDPEYIGILYGDGFGGSNRITTVGYPAYSFFMNKQVYDANGNPIEGLYEDLSGEGGVVAADNADKYIYHNPVPDYLMGLSISFNYKNFDASLLARVNIGNYVYNQVAAGNSYDQMQQVGYWKNSPTYLSDTQFVKRQFTSDYFVENASFLKLDNLSAGYRFDELIDKMNMRVSLTVQNLFTITKYSGLDPEVDGGMDNNFYPRPRTFLLGVSLNF